MKGSAKLQGIVFIYEESRSVKNNALTVRIEERRKEGNSWMPAGPQKVYTARDLHRPGLKILDNTLFSMAFKSETDFRQMEARFFSPDQEYTLFRISPYDLKAFLDRCNAKNLLCSKDGRLLRFQYVKKMIPEIVFKDSGKAFDAVLTLEGHKIPAPCYGTPSNPVRIISGTRVYELPKGLPVGVIKDLVRGKTIPYDELDETLAGLSRYAGKLSLNIPGRTKKMDRHAEFTPVLDFDPDLKHADLGFEYKGIGLLSMTDTRQVLLNHKTNLELHRDFDEEIKYRDMLKRHGAVFESHAPKDCFIPERNREKILLHAQKQGGVLKVAGCSLVLDIKVAWDIRTKEAEILVGGNVCYQGKQTGMENILDACLCGQPWFDLPGGLKGFIPTGLARDFEQLELRGDFRDEDVRFGKYDLSFIARFLDNKENVVRDQAFKRYLAFLKNRCASDQPVKVPKTLKAELRPYQKTGFAWLRGLAGFGFCGILADDMGLGKTVQVLTFLLEVKEQSGGTHTSLVIVPKILMWNWESEAKRFAPDLRVLVYAGASRDKLLSNLCDADLVITSYGLVRQDEEHLTRILWDMLVLDEAQAIKNPKSQISKSVKRLKAANRLSLTGTPIENRPLDLWSQFDFLMPGFLGDKTVFQKTYAGQDQDALSRLKILTAPFILRRMKKQVCKELPPKTEITLYCGFSKEQKACYDDILNAGKRKLTDNQKRGESRTMQILTLLLRLRQASCHPALVTGTDPGSGFRPEKSSQKFELVLETAREIIQSGYKILIFSQFVALLDLVDQMFGAHGIKRFTLYGRTKKRQDQIRGFKKSPDSCAFLISLKAGGLGLNLTEAGYVFLLDPWWNPAVENQAVDRSHRIGQENPVTVYRFITRNSVEENIGRLQAKKQAMGKAVLGHKGLSDAGISEKELLELIN
ncbi:DEAD/DEAH box helicase [Desulfobacter curvatus]|uniref:DEAD/DEAH box helicase n=1 Tax=Desulfobacter curvatus TaxID=2290 RepID=UPI000376B68B|nr:DEAD/DEAH box helicase [Desulfobacter curvatus]